MEKMPSLLERASAETPCTDFSSLCFIYASSEISLQEYHEPPVRSAGIAYWISLQATRARMIFKALLADIETVRTWDDADDGV